MQRSRQLVQTHLNQKRSQQTVARCLKAKVYDCVA